MDRFSCSYKLNKLDMLVSIKITDDVLTIEGITPTKEVAVDVHTSCKCDCSIKNMMGYEPHKTIFKGYLQISANDVSFKVCNIGPSRQFADFVSTHC